MKTPKWEEGVHGAIQRYPLENGQKLFPHGKVTPGMSVTAKCKGKSIRLRIVQETESEIFKATVVGHYFLNTLEELLDGDEVSINRKYILWLQGGN